MRGVFAYNIRMDNDIPARGTINGQETRFRTKDRAEGTERRALRTVCRPDRTRGDSRFRDANGCSCRSRGTHHRPDRAHGADRFRGARGCFHTTNDRTHGSRSRKGCRGRCKNSEEKSEEARAPI